MLIVIQGEPRLVAVKNRRCRRKLREEDLCEVVTSQATPSSLHRPYQRHHQALCHAMPDQQSIAQDAVKEQSFTPLPPRKPFEPSLRYSSNKKTIYDRNLNRTKSTEISLASFAYLFNQLITYHHSRSPSVSELESRLNRAGYPIGVKLLDLLLYRQPRAATRPTRLLELLQFIHGTLWRALFGRNADALEQSTTKKNEYMIVDNEPVVNTYISIPKEMSQLNCAAFVAGIMEGVCDAAAFSTDGVSAHWAGEGNEMWPGKTIFLLRFKDTVVEREEAIKAGGG